MGEPSRVDVIEALQELLEEVTAHPFGEWATSLNVVHQLAPRDYLLHDVADLFRLLTIWSSHLCLLFSVIVADDVLVAELLQSCDLAVEVAHCLLVELWIRVVKDFDCILCAVGPLSELYLGSEPGPKFCSKDVIVNF